MVVRYSPVNGQPIIIITASYQFGIGLLMLVCLRADMVERMNIEERFHGGS